MYRRLRGTIVQSGYADHNGCMDLVAQSPRQPTIGCKSLPEDWKMVLELKAFPSKVPVASLCLQICSTPSPGSLFVFT